MQTNRHHELERCFSQFCERAYNPPKQAMYAFLLFVASGIQHPLRMDHIVICGLPGCTVFFHSIL
jgi:hypothetical protein